MKIIDKHSGKRVGSENTEVKSVQKKLKEEDPILRNANKEENLEEFSAMDPPDAFDKSRTIGVDYKKLNSFTQELIDEHDEVLKMVDEFDKNLISFKENGFIIDKDINDGFNRFFHYFDEHIVPHNRKEERDFFRILHDRLIESGEHGVGDEPSTAVDLMEDDHSKFLQLAALCFNFLGLGTRLKDLESRAITFDLAFNNGRELTELLRLHIFRENETLFPLAESLLTTEDFKHINV